MEEQRKIEEINDALIVKTEQALAEKILYLAERATTAAEVEALAAVVQAFVNFQLFRIRG